MRERVPKASLALGTRRGHRPVHGERTDAGVPQGASLITGFICSLSADFGFVAEFPPWIHQHKAKASGGDTAIYAVSTPDASE